MMKWRPAYIIPQFIFVPEERKEETADERILKREGGKKSHRKLTFTSEQVLFKFILVQWKESSIKLFTKQKHYGI